MSISRSAGLLLMLSAAAHCGAQSDVRVVVLDGHNGRPVTGARVSINVVRNFASRDVPAVIAGDKYSVQLDNGDTIVLGSVTKSDRSWNEYRMCATVQEDRLIYSVAAIMSKGLKTPNRCTEKISATPSPGEIVFFVTRLPFWQRLNLFRD